MGERLSGILLHPTSLPGRHGVGDLGAGTTRWLDWLAEAGQGLWQVLPLGPTGLAGSPYDGPSGFAGDPLLTSLDGLVEQGLLTAESLEPESPFPTATVELARVRVWKEQRLREAWEELRLRGGEDPLTREIAAWAGAPQQEAWCDDWTLFAALRDRFAAPWVDWPPELRDRRPQAIRRARAELAGPIGYQRFVQFLFWRQWSAVRRQAADRGIRILGDLPIYVALDSAEVWCHRQLFDLDPDGRPTHVSGVPPDAFSEDGQLWGHPLYRWDRLRASGYRWWIDRLRQALLQADRVRIDHFRAFAAYWQVPADAATAAAGRWRPGPGREFFTAVERALGDLRLVAEDLGVITDDVRELRRELCLPGMRVLQFGLEEGEGEHLPDRWEPNLVVYTGTHDSDTSAGWLAALDPEVRQRVQRELGAEREIHWAMIRAVLTSIADTAVIPLQDVLGLGSEGRFNTPGSDAGNWVWRFRWSQLTPELGRRLRRLSELSRRASPAGAGAPGG